MKDLRQPNIHIGNTVKISKLEINEDNVKEILMTLGVMPTETLIREAIGYLSSNGLEFTMLNLYNFLKSKSIMSMKDLRKTKLIIRQKRLFLTKDLNSSMSRFMKSFSSAILCLTLATPLLSSFSSVGVMAPTMLTISVSYSIVP